MWLIGLIFPSCGHTGQRNRLYPWIIVFFLRAFEACQAEKSLTGRWRFWAVLRPDVYVREFFRFLRFQSAIVTAAYACMNKSRVWTCNWQNKSDSFDRDPGEGVKTVNHLHGACLFSCEKTHLPRTRSSQLCAVQCRVTFMSGSRITYAQICLRLEITCSVCFTDCLCRMRREKNKPCCSCPLRFIKLEIRKIFVPMTPVCMELLSLA